ncbi:hypothetical protein SALBM311S_00727 [Streptomyces alboniger]
MRCPGAIRPLVRQAFGHRPVVGQLLRGEPGVESDQARPVREQVPQGQAALALRRELRPVVGDFTVQFEGAVLHQERGHQVGRPLRR